MPTLVFMEQSYPCSVAIRGSDYIHLLDENGIMTAAFDKITDFSDYTLQDGSYTSPTADGNCKVAVVRDDGTIGVGEHACADIGKGITKKVSVSLSATWSGSGPYTQTVTIPNVTANTKVDLEPSPAQLAALSEAGITLTTENDGGTVTVYAIGDKPAAMTVQATLTEVTA